jgi:toxin ParE1/3/4
LSKRVVWSFLSIEDRETIFDYIEGDSPLAAILVDDRIETQVEALESFPEMGRQGRVTDTRELVIQKTPYIAAYRVSDGEVKILRVLHGAQVWPDEL